MQPKVPATVLVVDDRAANREWLASLLIQDGHRVVTASGAVDAMACARAECPDLIVTAALMDDVDGFELIRDLRADDDLAAVRAVLFSRGFSATELEPFARAAGVRHVVSRPGDGAGMLSAVAIALAEPAPQADAFSVDELARLHVRALKVKLNQKLRDLEASNSWLVKSEATFRSLTEASPFGILLVSDRGVIEYANARALAESGQSTAEDMNARWPELVHPEDREEMEAIVGPALAARLSHRYRARLRFADGATRHFDVRSEPISGPWDSQSGFVCTLEDVTAAVEGEQARAGLEARVRVSERLESLGQLAGGVAHDFNNLLAVMQNYATFASQSLELLDSGRPDPALEGARRDLDQIRLACDRAAALTNQLLVFGRADVVETEEVDLNELIDSLHDLLRRTIGGHIVLSTVLDAEAWPVSAERSRLEQVALNLVVNARDAVSSTGQIVVTTSNVEVDAAEAIRLGLPEEGRYVRLGVTDSGEGMAPEVVERCLDPFFTTKAKGVGTGLGLATVHGVIVQLGGAIAIDSLPGVGTDIGVYVPAMIRRIDTPVQGTRPSASAQNGSGEYILLVEDQEELLLTTARLLRDCGYSVIPTADAERALALVADSSVTIDVLLTDVVMPTMSGRQLAERAVLLRPHLAVMFVSGSVDVAPGDQPTTNGATVLSKPFSAAALRAAVSELLERAATRA